MIAFNGPDTMEAEGVERWVIETTGKLSFRPVVAGDIFFDVLKGKKIILRLVRSGVGDVKRGLAEGFLEIPLEKRAAEEKGG